MLRAQDPAWRWSAMAFAVAAMVATGPARAEARCHPNPDEAEEAGLWLLNWSDYMDPTLLAAFEAACGVPVHELYFENDVARDRIMTETDGGRGIDLLIIDDLTLSAYIDHGWVARLDPAEIPNRSQLDPRWLALRPQYADYAVPYLWGTFGIAYRADLVAQPITSWRQIFEPAGELDGRIVMVTDPHDLVGPALMALGYSFNATSEAELSAAAALLERQRPHLFAYGYLALTAESTLVTGQVVAATVYSGEALTLRQFSDNIRYVTPEEGSLIWLDYIAVAQASAKKDMAMQFINFLNEPENAARLAQYAYFATPNAGAEALLPEDFLNDETVYPPAEVLARSTFHDVGMSPGALRARAEIVASLIGHR